MNILHLKYAIAVSETGSISRAAEKLFVAQPNVSRAIKELENDLDIIIFDRNTKGMILTPDGERLINYGKKLLYQIDELEKTFKDKKTKTVFSISVPRASYISSAFIDFSKKLKKFKNVEVFYRETNAYRVINNIMNEDYHLGIIRYSKNYDKYFKETLVKKDLKYEIVNEFKPLLLVSENSKLANLDSVSINDLVGLTEIAHGDPYVPSLPVSELAKSDKKIPNTKKIWIFERGSQFELLENNDDMFMWVSPVPKHILEKHHLKQLKCVDNDKEFKDLLIYKNSYILSDVDKEFITSLCMSRRKTNID